MNNLTMGARRHKDGGRRTAHGLVYGHYFSPRFSRLKKRYEGSEMTAIPLTTEPAAPSAAAERMRRHRQRRRDGLRCFMIELRETEIDALIRNGLLAAENRHDYDSVQSALYAFLDRALGELGDA
jgi:hypothetical protein